MQLHLFASEPSPRWCGSPPKPIDKRKVCKQQGDQRDPLRKRTCESTDKFLRAAVTDTAQLTSTLHIDCGYDVSTDALRTTRTMTGSMQPN